MFPRVAILLLTLCSSYFFGHSQIITTISGTPGVHGYSGDGGPASAALLSGAYGITTDPAGNILVSDWNNRVIRKINTSGIITTIAGNGVPGTGGDGGPATAAQLHTVDDIEIDSEGNIYFPDHASYVVRKINNAGIITRFAGTGAPPPNAAIIGDGGPALLSPLYNPSDVAVDIQNNVYVADPSTGVIRKIDRNGIITTIAGLGFTQQGYSGDGGPASAAKLHVPIAVEVDNAGNIYIADLGNHVIRKINPQGIISTFAGNGQAGYSGDGGLAINAKFSRPNGLAIDNAGNLYVADETHHVIRKISPAGIITTVAGTGVEGYDGDGGLAIHAKLTVPIKLAVDHAGNLYVTDYHNHTVRKIAKCTGAVISSVSISASESEICKGGTVTFTATPVNGGNQPFYRWQVNGVDASEHSSQFSISTLKNGDIVSCSMVSSEPCSDQVNSVNSISMIVHDAPLISIGPDLNIPGGGSVQLPVSATGNNLTYQWSPPTGLSDISIVNPIASPFTTTTYELTVLSENGCEATGRITVNVIRGLYIPSAFTPNGDGKNDVFKIPMGTGMVVKEFTVYNRWGNTVFSTKSAATGWDGRWGAIAADAGVYVYSITGEKDGEMILIKGTVTLIR